MENTEVKRGRGRPAGSLGKLAREARAQAERTGQLPHEILLDIARGEVMFAKTMVNGVLTRVAQHPDLQMRKDAARDAAPYYAPKIATVEVIQGVTDADLDEIIARAAAEAGIGIGTDGEGETDEEERRAPVSTRRIIRVPE